VTWIVRVLLGAAVIVVLLALLPSHALAGARVALLIGNQGYNAKVGPLNMQHPVNPGHYIECGVKPGQTVGAAQQTNGPSTRLAYAP